MPHLQPVMSPHSFCGVGAEAIAAIARAQTLDWRRSGAAGLKLCAYVHEHAVRCGTHSRDLTPSLLVVGTGAANDDGMHRRWPPAAP